MKKIFFSLGVFLLCSVLFLNTDNVAASVLKVEDIISDFNQSSAVEELSSLGIDLTSKKDELNQLLDIYNNEEKVFSFTYGDDYLEYNNRDAEVTEENAYDDIFTAIYIDLVLDSIFRLSGYNNKTFSDNLAADLDKISYDEYGFKMEVEPYSFSGEDENGSWTNSGNFVKYFKISLNTDKIDALIAKYGVDKDSNDDKTNYSEEILALVPVVEAKDITENSATIYVTVSSDNIDIPDDIMCNVYRSTSKDGKYENVIDGSVNCSGAIGITDDDLNSNTTYYYKAVVVGGSKYSKPISVTTKSLSKEEETKKDEVTENPKTGVVTNTIIISTGIVLAGGIYYYLRKKNIMNKI